MILAMSKPNEGIEGTIVPALIPYSKMQTNASTAKKNTHPIWSVKSFGILIASLMLMAFGLWGVFSSSPQQTTPSQQTTIVYQPQPVAKKYITKNIEDIQKGDLVYAYDVTTCEVSLKEVTDTFTRTSDHLRYLTTTNENDVAQTFETTDAHPFWVVTNNPDLERVTRNVVIENGTVLGHENIPITEHGYYVEAKDLNVGDIFIGANGEQTTLTATSRKEFPNGITVYNFSVEDNHNYYVIANLEAYENGAGVVLVHNAEYRKNHNRDLSEEDAPIPRKVKPDSMKPGHIMDKKTMDAIEKKYGRSDDKRQAFHEYINGMKGRGETLSWAELNALARDF
jgi:hypothetical protein